MTDKAPERIWAHPEQHPNYKSWDADGWCTSTKQEGGKWTPYVRADLLEAAQARITGLEAEVSAWRQVRDAVAELEGLGPDWPSHGNAPLAVTSGYALHRQRAATARADALEAANARIRELEALAELNRVDAFAATNPANWQRNNTLQARHDHFAKTLDEISERGEDITILEDTYEDGRKMGAATARAEALEEAAVKAEREGVYPELNVWDGGPDWYKHGKRIAAAIRALKEKPNG